MKIEKVLEVLNKALEEKDSRPATPDCDCVITEAWTGSDDLEYMAGLLRDLARENKKGNVVIAPGQQEELCLLAALAKRVIVSCISAPMPGISKRGDKQCRL